MSTLRLDQAQRVDIVCRRGDTFKMVLNVRDSSGAVVNVSGSAFTYKMEVRETDTATGTVIPTSATGFVFAGNASGVLNVTVTSTTMAAVNSGLYVYDLQATRVSDSFVQTWLYGTFLVNEDVTVP